MEILYQLQVDNTHVVYPFISRYLKVELAWVINVASALVYKVIVNNEPPTCMPRLPNEMVNRDLFAAA